MASQVCNRCRKRRIKCDRKLPACNNCQRSDVDCFLWDDTLNKEIPAAYLDTLRRKVRGLQADIENLRSTPVSSATTSHNNLGSRRSYHLRPETTATAEELQQCSKFIGPNKSGGILRNLLRMLQHVAETSGHDFTLDPNQIEDLIEPRPQVSLAITADPRKIDLHSIVPPSTQRTIVEHYLSIVHPEFQLLGRKHEAELAACENPLKTHGLKKNDVAGLSLMVVFAISTTLLARDMDANLASVAFRCRAELQTYSLGNADRLGQAKAAVAVSCALVVCEIASPTDGQFWDLLDRAASLLQDLQQEYVLSSVDKDEDYWRLNRILLKLESLATAHFGRPSLFFDSLLLLNMTSSPHVIDGSDDLLIAKWTLDTASYFANVVTFDETYLEAQIPANLQVVTHDSVMGLPSASYYFVLYPLLTAHGRSMDPGFPSPRMVQLITTSAALVIDHAAKLDDVRGTISLWLAAERVFSAGAVWLTGLLHQESALESTLHGHLGTALKVTRLLTSFAARWRGAEAYATAWNILMSLMSA